jgi:serine O-acetyltransferase
MEDFIASQVNACLFECARGSFISSFKQNAFDLVVAKFGLDVSAFLSKDPSCKNNVNFLMHYTSLKAVLHYRIANQIIQEGLDPEVAFSISNRGKLLSQAEIHPFANIGHSFILDHGVGTVIGETTRIGNHAYILGGVILGACGISNNGDLKRHPTLGDWVEVGTRAKVLGPVHVGDHVFIGADCLVAEDVNDFSRVVLTKTIQITKHAQWSGRKAGPCAYS